jgi:hypothetical protein
MLGHYVNLLTDFGFKKIWLFMCFRQVGVQADPLKCSGQTHCSRKRQSARIAPFSTAAWVTDQCSTFKRSSTVFVKIVVASFFTNPYLSVFPDSAIPHAFSPSFGLGQTSVPGAWPWLLDTAHRGPPAQPRLPLGAAVPV